MKRDKILREILSDPDLSSKYNIKDKEIRTLTTNPPYHKKVIEVLSVIINENDNHLSPSMIYRKLKNVHNI